MARMVKALLGSSDSSSLPEGVALKGTETGAFDSEADGAGFAEGVTADFAGAEPEVADTGDADFTPEAGAEGAFGFPPKAAGFGGSGAAERGAVPGTATFGGIEAGPCAVIPGLGSRLGLMGATGADDTGGVDVGIGAVTRLIDFVSELGVVSLGAAGAEAVGAGGLGAGLAGIAFKGIASVMAFGTGAEITGFGAIIGAIAGAFVVGNEFG